MPKIFQWKIWLSKNLGDSFKSPLKTNHAHTHTKEKKYILSIMHESRNHADFKITSHNFYRYICR